MTTLTIQGDLGRRVLVSVQGYERESALDSYDANWLRCSADVEHGAFRGTVAASFSTDDFSRFLEALDEIMSGSGTVAHFTTMEQALDLRVEVDRAGRATVNGQLREHGEFGGALSFAFGSDRSFLAATHADLKGIVAAFPVRTVAR